MAASSRGGVLPLGGLGSGRPQREGGIEEGKGDGVGGGDDAGIVDEKVVRVVAGDIAGEGRLDP